MPGCCCALALAATIMLDFTAVKLDKKATLSVYSGVAAPSRSLVAQLTAKDSQPGALLPRVALPAAQWAQ